MREPPAVGKIAFLTWSSWYCNKTTKPAQVLLAGSKESTPRWSFLQEVTSLSLPGHRAPSGSQKWDGQLCDQPLLPEEEAAGHGRLGHPLPGLYSSPLNAASSLQEKLGVPMAHSSASQERPSPPEVFHLPRPP